MGILQGAEADAAVRDEALLSTDRFVGELDDLMATPAQRSEVLADLGWFGVRLGVQALLEEPGMTSSAMAARLRDVSGIDVLRGVLTEQFTARADILKVHAAATVLGTVLARERVEGAAAMAAELEGVLASAHGYAELRLLSLLRIGIVPLREAEQVEAERLLGAGGTATPARLGLDPDASTDVVVGAAVDQLSRWRRRGEHPLSSREIKDAAAVLVRTCEGIVADAQMHDVRSRDR